MKPGLLRTSIIMCIAGAAWGATAALLHLPALVVGLVSIALCLVLGITFDPVLGGTWGDRSRFNR